jgi:CheY-like chemotaxis protein
MSSTLILVVGSDWSSVKSSHLVLQSAGYTVVQSLSIATAIRQLNEGDFDLLLLDHSLTQDDQVFLARYLRNCGSRIPILSISSPANPASTTENPAVRNNPASILSGVNEALRCHSRAPILGCGNPSDRVVAKVARTSKALDLSRIK